jgi:hypothetical protein
MTRRTALVLVVTAALLLHGPLRAEQARDAEVAGGIQLVESGDYDQAILALDNDARRLAKDPSHLADLSDAYVYLGIAYLGKGHEAAARASFREALARVKNLSLNPEKYPPKVIDAFEAARDETARVASASPPVTPQTAPAKKGHSEAVLLVGAGVLAAGGVAVVAVGGGGKSTTPTTLAQPLQPLQTETFSGTLRPEEGSRRFSIAVAAAGTLQATVTWTMPAGKTAVLTMQLFDRAAVAVATANRTNDTSASLSAAVSPQEYSLSLFYDNECIGCGTAFQITVRHP